jgi:hypothetical protein
MVLSFSPTPLGDKLSRTPEDARQLGIYPLDVAQCPSCQHVFLPTVVDPDASYSDYFFETSKSPGLSNSMMRLAHELWLEVATTSPVRVVDIGSNDGTWLQHFKNYGAQVLGIEPSERHATGAAEVGVETLHGYFTPASAQQIRNETGSPDLITANFVTANIPNLGEFFEALRILSDRDSLIAIMTGYHPDQFRVNMFDFVYHEHVSYFTVQDFVNLGARYGFSVVGATRHSLKGGSLQVLLRRTPNSVQHSIDVLRLARQEDWLGVRDESWFLDLQTRISRERAHTHQLLDAMRCRSIIGYGVSHSVTTLLYHFELTDRVAALADDNESRQGLYAPGTGMEVLHPDHVASGDFDAVVILAWQHDGLIRKRLREIGWRGPVVQPLPGAALVSMGG